MHTPSGSSGRLAPRGRRCGRSVQSVLSPPAATSRLAARLSASRRHRLTSYPHQCSLAPGAIQNVECGPFHHTSAAAKASRRRLPLQHAGPLTRPATASPARANPRGPATAGDETPNVHAPATHDDATRERKRARGSGVVEFMRPYFCRRHQFQEPCPIFPTIGSSS